MLLSSYVQAACRVSFQEHVSFLSADYVSFISLIERRPPAAFRCQTLHVPEVSTLRTIHPCLLEKILGSMSCAESTCSSKLFSCYGLPVYVDGFLVD